MQVLYWQSTVYGQTRATLVASDGHILLAGVPVEHTEAVESAVRDAVNACERLPATRETLCDLLCERGFVDVTPEGSSQMALEYRPETEAGAEPKPKKATAKAKPKKATAKAKPKKAAGEVEVPIDPIDVSDNPEEVEITEPEPNTEPEDVPGDDEDDGA